MEEKVAVLAAKVQTRLLEGKVPGSKTSSVLSLDFMLGEANMSLSIATLQTSQKTNNSLVVGQSQPGFEAQTLCRKRWLCAPQCL